MNNTPYNLIAKYFTNECSEQELVEAQAWIDANQEEFRQLKSIWLISSADLREISASRKRTWKRISARSGRVNANRRSPGWIRFAAAAAAAILIIGGFCVGWYFAPKTEKTIAQSLIVRTQNGQKAEITLPDSTHIWLNSGTTISYPSDYNITNRNVQLVEGEAFFEVTRSDKHNFTVVNKDGIGVKVYGTEFNVNSYSDIPEVSVTLEKGHIDVVGRDGNTMSELAPGQKLIWKKELNDYSVVECDPENESIWRYGELRVDRLPLNKVISLMEKWYGVNIEITGASESDKLYWMTIKTETLREMLDLLNNITPIEYQIQGKEVIVSIKN